MAKNNQRNFSILSSVLIGQIISCSIGVQSVETTRSDYEQLRIDRFYLRNFNTSNLVDRILNHNWTQNHECLTELNAIKTGLENQEEWAIRVIDSWGNFPSGTFNGNAYDLGSFSQCFHIERNKQPYKTQYCAGKVFLSSQNKSVPAKLRAYASITLGLCFPATCAVKHLESVVNRTIRNEFSNMRVIIPEQKCQHEEKVTGWKPIDLITIGLIGIVLLLMVASTAYDISATMNNRKKYQPFIVFSVYTNGEKLFACKKLGPSSGMIQCMNGIRVITTMWVVFIHAFRDFSSVPLHNGTAYIEFTGAYYSVFLKALFPAETFLVISGLLASYKLMRLLKKDGKLDIISLYYNRLLRLTPVLAVTVLLSISIFRFLGNGPHWLQTVSNYSGPCQHYWWSTLLYIQNYVNPQELCIGPSWYLSVDMQLFVISPALAYLVHRFKSTAILALLISIMCGVGYTQYSYITNNVRSMNFLPPTIYTPTHFRFPPWVIGFITGYMLFKYPKGSIRIPKKLNLLAWICSLVAMLTVIIEHYPNYQPTANLLPFEFGIFESLARITWSSCLSYIIFACAHDSGGVVNWFLSLPMWQPLAKLSFSIYLIHYLILNVTMFTYETTTTFSKLAALQSGISVFVISAFVSIPLVLAFELPIDAFNKLTTKTKSEEPPSNEIPSKPVEQLKEKFSCCKIEKFDEKL